MSIDRSDFDAVNEADLRELIDGQVIENPRLEFKRDIYGNSDASKSELLKDVSALANTLGGHLIIGIEEIGGSAANLVGIGDIDVDTEILRMENIIRTGLDPTISGVRIRSIPISDQSPILLVRVPRSWNPPHRVIARGTNRFFLRNSAGVYEPSVEELRVLFTQSTTALEAARRFRDERIERVVAGIGNRPLVAGGRLFIHMVPNGAFSGTINLDVGEIYQQHQAFRPIASTGLSPRYNLDGFVNERGGADNHGYTQIFRNGCLEATFAGILREQNGSIFVSGTGLERKIFDVISSYLFGLRDIGVPPPIVIMFSLEGVAGAGYAVNDEGGPALSENLTKLPECVLEDFGEELDHHKAVRPAFDALWNAIGFPKCMHFGEEGYWGR